MFGRFELQQIAADADCAAILSTPTLIAKLAAEDGRFDDALASIDKVLQKAPGNPVVLFERAMILIDAGRTYSKR